MFFKRLFSTGPGGIAEWKRMWNDEVLPYLRGAQLVAGPGIRIDRRPAGTLIRVVSSGGGSADTGGGGVQLAVVTTSPSGNFGVGACTPVEFSTNGTYQVTDDDPISTITPFI